MTKLAAFDASKFFGDEESQLDLLSDAFSTGEAGYIAAAIGTVARAHGVGELSRETGLNRATLYASLKANGNPTLDTVLKILEALGIELAPRPKASRELEHA